MFQDDQFPRLVQTTSDAPSNGVAHALQYDLIMSDGPELPIKYPPQPVEIDPSFNRSPPLYPQWEQASYFTPTIEGNSNFSPTSIARPLQQPIDPQIPSASQQHPLINWYSRNDGPWYLKAALPDLSVGPKDQAGSYDTGLNPEVFSQGASPGNRGVASDSENHQFGRTNSDSGYGGSSGIENASTRSWNMRGPFPSDQALRNLTSTAQTPLSPDVLCKGIGVLPSSLECRVCGKQSKTKSEFKKHKYRHSKPFVCQHSGCPRAREGFTSRNDLDRHIRSVHPNDIGDEDAKLYRCLHLRCKSKDKTWSRLDNFRCHLRRIHKMTAGALDEFVQWTEEQLHLNIETEVVEPRCEQSLLHDQGSPVIPKEHLLDPRLKEPVQENGTLLSDQGLSLSNIPASSDATPVKSVNGTAPAPRPASIPASNHTESRNFNSTSKPIAGQVGTGHCKDNDRKTCNGQAESLCFQKPPSTGKHNCESSEQGHNTTIDQNLREAIAAALAKIRNRTSSLPSHDSAQGTTTKTLDLVAEVRQPIGDTEPEPSALETLSTQQSENIKVSNVLVKDRDENSGSSSSDQDLLRVILTAVQEKFVVIAKESPSELDASQQAPLETNTKVHKGRREDLICPQCKKVIGKLGRPSELRKHMKRHERPYGCTFINCKKKFGSKNDWKRHEHTQHFQRESWRCTHLGEGRLCHKTLSHIESYKSHLTDTHHVMEDEISRYLEDSQKVDNKLQGKFWCGFCVAYVELKNRGVEAWSERSNHIDDHFWGRSGKSKQGIEEWQQEGNGSFNSLSRKLSGSSPTPEKSDSNSSDPPPSMSPISSDSSPSAASSPEMDTLSCGNKQSQLQRKRPGIDNEQPRPQKQAKSHYEKKRKVIFCCDCGEFTYLGTSLVCTSGDNHKFCDRCTIE